MIHFCKKYSAVALLMASIFQLNSGHSTTMAIIGGKDQSNTPYAALVAENGQTTALSGDLPTGNGQINSVAINASGKAMIGGVDSRLHSSDTPYLAFISPNGETTSLSEALGEDSGTISAVAINASGQGLIGARFGCSTPFAAVVSPNGAITPVSGSAAPSGDGRINAVAINSSGLGIIGGSDGFQAYAALVSQNGETTALSGAAAPGGEGEVRAVAINHSGNAIIAGADFGSGGSYAALVSPTGATTALSGDPLPQSGSLLSVAINHSGNAIIGGGGVCSPAYAALVSSTGQTTALPGASIPSFGSIESVAINTSGAAMIGGRDIQGSFFYAGLVSPNGETTPLTGLPTDPGGIIHSVGISDSGVGIIGGENENSNTSYVALVAPNGELTSLLGNAIPSEQGAIYSVSIATLPSPGGGGSLIHSVDPKSFGPGNTFADPIFSLSTAVLENHLNGYQQTQTNPSQSAETAALTADANNGVRQPPACEKAPDYALWTSPFGFYARYKKEAAFSALRDRGLGGILGFDYIRWKDIVVGGGAAYAYQDVNYLDVNYLDDQSSAKVHQGFLTVYGGWEATNISIHAALWGGGYHMKNNRDTLGIITSKSSVNGWIFCPHLEVSAPIIQKGMIFEPFAQLDWANNWQGAVKETGKGGLHLRIKRHYVSVLRSEIGLRLTQPLHYKTGTLTFKESFSYVNKAPFNAKQVSASYIGSVSTFNLQMFSNRVENLGAVRLSGLFTPNRIKHPSVSLIYQGEFGTRLQSHTIALELKKRF